MSFALVALISAFLTATAPSHRLGAASAAAQPAIQRLPGPMDIVYADPRNVMYSYGPSEAERFSLQAENAFSSTITVTYDAGFMANPQAQAAFQAAVDIWRNVIVSPATIRVSASYHDLGSPNILGSAGASFVCIVPGGLANTFYAAALADKINGVAQSCSGPDSPEIVANFNSTFTNWDFGTSGVPVSGKYSFLTVVLHELGHGLGFFGSMAVTSSGIGSFGFGTTTPTIYDRFAVTGGGGPLLIDYVNPSSALGSQLVSNNTFFNGTSATANNGGANAKLETHNFTTSYGIATPGSFGWLPGSSYSHLDDLLYTGTPNGLMTFALGTAEVYTDPGPIMRGMFLDEGWSLTGASSAPSITSQPVNQTINSGSTATLTVLASGTAPLVYQWYVGTTGNTSTPVGTNSNSFTTPTLTNTTSYWVRVSNSVGTADSNTATITVNTPPAITSQPANQAVKKGQTAQFIVAASGFPAPAYQWQISTNGGSTWSNLPNTAPFSGVTTTTLTVSNATLAMNGTRYRCVATNIAGSAASNAATLLVVVNVRTDFDGDGKADVGIYRPSNGTWYVLQSSMSNSTFTSTMWGTGSDVPVPGDYDGDGKADVAVFRPSTGVWYILQSSTNFATYTSTTFGVGTDVPVPRDYDGDGKADIAVYRASSGTWYILQSSTNNATYSSTLWGTMNDVPVPGDYDADGKADIAVYRASSGTWYILQSSTNNATYSSTLWGTMNDVPVPGDYDGDGKADIAVYRPSSGVWYVLQSSTNNSTFSSNAWGTGSDVPLPGDYDGDGKADLAIFRPATGVWYILQSSTNNSTFLSPSLGISTDIQVPGDFDGDGRADVVVYRPSTGVWSILQSSSNFTTSASVTWGNSTDVPLPQR
jgi:hypothetical protein